MKFVEYKDPDPGKETRHIMQVVVSTRQRDFLREHCATFGALNDQEDARLGTGGRALTTVRAVWEVIALELERKVREGKLPPEWGSWVGSVCHEVRLRALGEPYEYYGLG